MSEPKRELAIGEQAYLPADHIWVHKPEGDVFIYRRFFPERRLAGKNPVLVQRVSAHKYRLILPPGFRAVRYSQSATLTQQLLRAHEIVDERGGTHTTMPDKYLK